MQPAPRNLWIPLLIVSIIGAGLLGSMFFSPILVWMAITLAMFGAILIGHPRQILFLFWIWSSFRPLIRGMADHPIVRGSNGLFVLAVIGFCIAGYVWRRTNTGKISGLFKIVTALLGVTLASWLVNLSSISQAVWFFVNYLAFPFVFYVAYTTLDRRHWRYLFGAVIGQMLIQFALNVGWRLGVNPLPNMWKGTGNTYDFAQGTFGSCAHVAYFMVAVLFLLFSALRYRAKYRPWIILLLGVAAAQLYMTYTNHAYIIFIVLMPVYLVISKQSMKIRIACVAMVVLGLMAFSFLSAWDKSKSGLDYTADAMFTAENLEYRWDRFIRGPKIELINRIAVQNVTRDPFLWFLGNGPGNGLSAVGMKNGSGFAWEYLGAYVANSANFAANDMSSAIGGFYSGILSIWSELGVVGYFLNFSLYGYAVWRVLWQLFRNQYRDVFQRVLAEGFVMAMLFFFAASFIQDVFEHLYFTVGLWIWAAMVWDPVEPEEEKTDNGEQRTDDRGLSTPIPIVNGWPRPAMRK